MGFGDTEALRCPRGDMSHPSWQDGILFGMVGAYDWEGGVLEETQRWHIVPAREAFQEEFPLELKNHAAYLGMGDPEGWEDPEGWGCPKGCEVNQAYSISLRFEMNQGCFMSWRSGMKWGCSM